MISWWIPQGSTYAADIDFLIALIGVLVGFWFILTEGIFFWLIVKYRKQEGVKAAYMSGEEEYPKKYISRAHMAVLACDVLIIYFAVVVWYDVKQNLPEPEATVRVIGQQWAWSFQHSGPDGIIDTADDIKTVDEMRLQVGKLYHYQLESRDVLHNFSVPIFRLKQDSIPGRVITGWFKPTIEGDYSVQCAEICGIGHGIMAARVKIESEAAHTAWMQQHSTTALAANTQSPAAADAVVAQ